MSNNFNSPHGLAMPNGGLASRRGGPNVKPLTFDNQRQQTVDNGVPTPRTSRSHLLAGLRTAPRSATAASFASNPVSHQYARNGAVNGQGMAQGNMYNAPKTAYPQFGVQQNNFQQALAQQQLQQQQALAQQQQQQQQQYTVEQVMAPPELLMDENTHEQMDPNMYAQLVATNLYLAQQQQRLQQQLRNVQAAAQQFQQLNINNPNAAQQQMALFEQQQQLRALQQQLQMQSAISQNQQVYYNPMDGQYYVDTGVTQQVTSPYNEQPATPINAYMQQQYQQQYQQQQGQGTPRVQVSPPPENPQGAYRSNSPPKRQESPQDVQPLPPASANAFRRGHKKATSLAPINSALASGNGDAPKTAGLKTGVFPMTPTVGGYGPGQHRAGEHPVRQPRGPPGIEELKAKPTAKHEGSKNFATRTRRSAVHNLVRAGLERRKGTGSSNGSMSPVSESAEDTSTPITDNESDSGRSGSGSLAGEMDCASSRTSVSGNWGAIGSDRPSSRQKTRKSVESLKSAASASESDNSSFANVFKNGALRASKSQDSADQRKAARLVLTSAEKRRVGSTGI